MKNVFSPKDQIDNIEAKVIASFERIFNVFKNNLKDIANQYNLTLLQAQLLIFIAEHPSNLCSVTLLAKEFSVTKATISDSMKALIEKSYVEKIPNLNDARRFHLAVSKEGRPIVNKLNYFGLHMAGLMKSMTNSELENQAYLNLKLLNIFSQAGLIDCRMCYSCCYYEKKEQGFFCRLLKSNLPQSQLRLDCPEFKRINVN